MFKVEAIVPDREVIDVDLFIKVINDAMDAAARQVQSDFEQTQSTWVNKAEFPITTPFEFARDIQTEDEIYGWVNNGTKPHDITPKGNMSIRGATIGYGDFLRFNTPFAPKTQKNVVGSYAGNRGGVINYRRKVVQSILAREFDETIKRDWDSNQTLAKIIDAQLETVITP